jgi:hypothetical protein
LIDEIDFATYHPWPRLICDATGHFVITEDGREVRVNPRTMQLTDFRGFALFNGTSGRPIVFFNDDIITVTRTGILAQQKVENAVLLDSYTTNDLLQDGTPFYMGVIPVRFSPTDVRHYDVPMLNLGTPEEPDFRFMNGESTKDETLNHQMNYDTDDRVELPAWLWNPFALFGGLGCGNIGSTLGIILLVLIVLLAFGVLAWLKQKFFPKKEDKNNGNFNNNGCNHNNHNNANGNHDNNRNSSDKGG